MSLHNQFKPKLISQNQVHSMPNLQPLIQRHLPMLRKTYAIIKV